MFLKKILSDNKLLVETSIILHQQGKIPANSYVIDIDTLRSNASVLAKEANKYDLKIFAMTKQIGRNPIAIKALMEEGIQAGVCVDMADARPMHKAGMQIGHLGHLVQVPFAETEAAASMNPLYWMIYDMEKAKVVSKVTKTGKKQKIMTRVFGNGDNFYKGHEAGFSIDSILDTAKELEQMDQLSFAGIATFPAQLYNFQSMCLEHTPNYRTLLKAAELLRKAGFSSVEVNAPGTTSSMLFQGLAQDGVTQVEPGHGLTGTTPIHAYKDLAERPALVYVSEVSHNYGGKPYCFGGGMYLDPVFAPYDVKACVGNSPEQACKQLISCDMPKPEAIDYYGILQPESEQQVTIGDTVVFGFRPQIFVTRSYVVPVSGINKGNPKVEGIFFADGREVEWPI